MLISVVLPVYNEEEVLPTTFERLQQVAAKRPELEWEYIFVNDGSSDKSAQILNDFSQQYSYCKVIHFSRNFGHQPALTAGIDYATGDIVAVIDADLQDPPEVMLDMIKAIENGASVAYGQRTERLGESWFKVNSARFFYRLLAKITKVEIPLDTGDFRAMDRKAAKAISDMRENPRFLRGMFAWVGFKSVPIPYQRHSRAAGYTKFGIGRMFRFAFDALFSFSDVPLKLAVYAGIITFLVGGLGIAYILIQLYAFNNYIPGASGVMFVTLALGGVQLLTLGIIGQYISLIFEQTKRRPIYLVDNTRNIELSSITGVRPIT